MVIPFTAWKHFTVEYMDWSTKSPRACTAYRTVSKETVLY